MHALAVDPYEPAMLVVRPSVPLDIPVRSFEVAEHYRLTITCRGPLSRICAWFQRVFRPWRVAEPGHLRPSPTPIRPPLRSLFVKYRAPALEFRQRGHGEPSQGNPHWPS